MLIAKSARFIAKLITALKVQQKPFSSARNKLEIPFNHKSDL